MGYPSDTNKRYCTRCGAKLVEEWTGTFEERTGQKHMRMICSVDPCGHSGCENAKVKDLTLWEKLSLASVYECKRCGKRDRWYFPF